MKKRITAALLACFLLISVLPMGVYATETDTEEKVYQLGEQIWIQGTSDQPVGKTASGTLWAPVLTGDGMWESKPGECPLTEHRHSTSCYNAGGVLICQMEIHRHGPICKTKNAYYLWEVVVDVSYVPPETEPIEPDPSEPGPDEQGPGYSDPDAEYPEGSASFTLRNIDPDGNPLQDIEYYLLTTNNEVAGNFLTNENGEIVFGGLMLKDGVSAEILTLSQNPPLPDALDDYYEHNREVWNVTVVRNADGESFSVSNITLKEESTEQAEAQAQYEQGYDMATNTLTVINQPKLYNMMVTLKPILVTEEGIETMSIPTDMAVQVTIAGPDGKEMTINLPEGSSPQAYLEGLTAGTYTVTGIECENAQMNGYTLGQPYAVVALPKPSDDAERPVLEQDYINLSSEYAYPDFWIYLPYKMSSSLTVRVVDENDIRIQGSTVALMDGDTVVKEFNDENGYDIDLQDYAVEGETIKYSLQQTVVPDGYHETKDRWTVSVSVDSKDGKTQVSVKRDQSLLETIASLFSGDGPIIDSETGAQTAIFRNERKTTQVRLTCNMDVVFEDGTWQDAAFEEQLKGQNTFSLTWTGFDGTEHQESMKVAHGETKGFETPVPYGADYKVTGVIAEGTEFQGAQEITGQVELADLETAVHIDAEAQYTVESGVASQPLTMIMVDAEDTTKTLAGVPFQLTIGDETLTYTTNDQGQILIQGDYKEPVSFTLEEMEAPEGYEKLNAPIQVEVGAHYKSGGEYTVIQNFEAVPATHEALEKQAGDVYLIKNTRREVGTPIEGERSNKLLINVVTESGSPVEGTQITMTCPDGSQKTYTGGDVIDLEVLGMVGTYGLVQTKSVAGHMIATETYAVTVSEKDGKLSVKVENTNQGLLDKIFSKEEIPFGPDNEWVLTFTNVRQTATLRLTCEVVMNFTGGSWHDLEFEKKYKEETEYQFLLSWDDGYVREQDEAMLVHGESEIFELQVPYGVAYEIVCVNENGYFDTTYRNAKSTVVDSTALKEGMQITATNTYIIEPNPDADPVEVHLTKVDATTKDPLKGVAFELLDADDRKMASYTTGADGKIDIVDTLKIGGTYSLKETQALDGYETPSNPFSIDVDAEYSLFKASGKPVLKQSFTASMSSKFIEEQEDGSYLLKNYKEGQAPKDSGSKGSNPKTGDRFDIALWSGVLMVSVAGIVLLAADMTKKKRRVR